MKRAAGGGSRGGNQKISKLCVVVCVQRTSRRSPDLRFPLFQDLIQSSGSRRASWASPCSAVLQLSQICPFDATAGPSLKVLPHPAMLPWPRVFLTTPLPLPIATVFWHCSAHHCKLVEASAAHRRRPRMLIIHVHVCARPSDALAHAEARCTSQPSNKLRSRFIYLGNFAARTELPVFASSFFYGRRHIAARGGRAPPPRSHA
jgi:hypothetical protein